MNPPTSAAEPSRPNLAFPHPSEPTLIDLLSTAPVADQLDSWLDTSPAQFLSMTSAITGICPTLFDELAASITLKSRRPLRALASAGPVLQRRPRPEPLGIDLPRWLLDLPRARVTATKWRPLACDEDWLVEATLPDGRPLTARLLVTCVTGAVDESIVVDATAAELQLTLAELDHGGERFVAADPVLAATCLIEALGRHRVSFADDEPGSRWPGEEALVTWLIALLVHQAEPEGRVA